LLEPAAIETALGAIVDILDDGIVAQLRVAQASCQSLVAPVAELAFDQKPEPFGWLSGAASPVAWSSAKAFAIPRRPS